MVLTVAGVIAGGLWIRLMVAFDRRAGSHPLEGRARRAQMRWCRWLCRVYGIELELGGQSLAPPPVLLASNHVSWLDIVVISAVQPVVFLSKSEVADWPLVGPVATGLGTLYIQRGRRTAAQSAIDAMIGALKERRRVLFFPEGTTGTGIDLLPFRPRLFQAAIDAGVPVQPVAIDYRLPDGSHADAVSFRPGQSLANNVWALASIPRLRVRIDAGSPIPTDGASRSELSSRTRSSIRRRLTSADQFAEA
jgi:1-acyl-sn-glycerol-3-phosphate acyltransferase